MILCEVWLTNYMTNNAPARPARTTALVVDGERITAGVGAVRQGGGRLGVCLCNACGREVVWATSARTGRKYLANVSRGYLDQRFYVGADLHKCAPAPTAEVVSERVRVARENYAAQLASLPLDRMSEGEIRGARRTLDHLFDIEVGNV